MQCKICKAEIDDPSAGEICPDCRAKLAGAATDSSGLLGGVKAEAEAAAEAAGSDSLPALPETGVRELWRRVGEETGELVWPIGLANTRDGGLLVLDEPDEYRLARFDAEGRRTSVFAEVPVGEEEGALEDPSGLFVDGRGRVYVADSGNDRIAVWRKDGTFSHVIGTAGREPGEFARPVGVAVDDDGFVYVADSFNRRVQKLSADGLPCLDLERLDGLGEFREPSSLALGPNRTLYVVDSTANFVVKLSIEGRPLALWPAEGAGYEFEDATQIRVDARGDVFVADRKHARIQRFDPDGHLLARIRLAEEESDELEPCAFAVVAGRLIVADRLNEALVCFEPDDDPPRSEED